MSEENRVDIKELIQVKTRPYTVWNARDIWFGNDAAIKGGKHVPNVGDKIDFYENNILKEMLVVAVHEDTLIPELVEINRQPKEDSSLNQFIGVGPGYQSETWRIWYDPNVQPHTLMIDAVHLVYGTEASYIKLFKGRNTGPDGKVISQYAVNSSQYSENVPLYVVSDRWDGSEAIKRPPVCHTTETLKLGEEVTAVVYSDSGQPYSQNTFKVVFGNNVRSLNKEQRYVMGIELDSPFISLTDDRLLELPINMPLEGIFTRGKVLYSDGREMIIPIDGKRLKMIGTEYFVNTKINEINHLGLRYQLGENEMAWNTNSGESRHITEMYRYQTMDLDNSYAVNINIVPIWDRTRLAWELRYYLYNLDRDINLDVTAYIENGVNSDIFNGRKFGVTQHIAVALQLDRLDLGLAKYRHVQKFDIALVQEPSSLQRSYLIDYHTNQATSYGEYNIAAMKNPLGRIDDQRYYGIHLNEHVNATSYQEWLDRTFYCVQPIYNEQIELKAPLPTHVLIRSASNLDLITEIDIAQHWNDTIEGVLSNSFDVGDTILVEFIRKQGTTVLYLGMTPWVGYMPLGG